jgi:hypothetical protein
MTLSQMGDLRNAEAIKAQERMFGQQLGFNREELGARQGMFGQELGARVGMHGADLADRQAGRTAEYGNRREMFNLGATQDEKMFGLKNKAEEDRFTRGIAAQKDLADFSNPEAGMKRDLISRLRGSQNTDGPGGAPSVAKPSAGELVAAGLGGMVSDEDRIAYQMMLKQKELEAADAWAKKTGGVAPSKKLQKEGEFEGVKLEQGNRAELKALAESTPEHRNAVTTLTAAVDDGNPIAIENAVANMIQNYRANGISQRDADLAVSTLVREIMPSKFGDFMGRAGVGLSLGISDYNKVRPTLQTYIK